MLAENHNADLAVSWYEDAAPPLPVIPRTSEAREPEAVADSRLACFLHTESPPACWNFANVVTTVTHALDQFFVARLPQDPRVKRVYWDSDDDTLKVWTVIPAPDFEFEVLIYQAQLGFMGMFPTYGCEFYVIYQFGKRLEDITPQGAQVVL